jgi:CelD/BcsL family acetyltransferase involved in cellulose biosynthesis
VIATARVDVRASLDGFATAWDDLVAGAPRPSPFLRSWWLDGIAGTRPCFVLVLEEDELVGGIALEVDHRPGVSRLRFIGSTLAADHLDAVAAPRRCDVVRRALTTWLARPGSRIIELLGVDEGALVCGAMPAPTQATPDEVAPWAALPSTFDEYWSARPSTLRNTVARTRKRLERDDVRYERMPAAHADAAVRDFVALHEGRWDGGSALAPLLDRFALVAHVGLRRGELVAHRLVQGDEAIAIELWFELAGVASFYQSGRSLDRRWRGAGSVLKAAVVEDACTRGIREIDLLRGDEPYKRDWTDRRRALFALSSAKGLPARAALAAFDLARGLRRGRNHVDAEEGTTNAG